MDKMYSRLTSVHFVPFVQLIELISQKEWWLLIYAIVGNCIWFIPFGFLLPLIVPKLQKIQYVIVLGCLTSLTIEILQFALCTGVTDIDDVILNTLGAIMGYSLYKLFHHKSFKVTSKCKS